MIIFTSQKLSLTFASRSESSSYHRRTHETAVRGCQRTSETLGSAQNGYEKITVIRSDLDELRFCSVGYITSSSSKQIVRINFPVKKKF